MGKNNQPIKILQGNNITLCASFYERNELGELNPLPLGALTIDASVYNARRGEQQLSYKIVGENTLAINCDTDTFSDIGVYALDIKAVNPDSGQKIRFAYNSIIQIVEYAEDLQSGYDCHTDKQGYTVVNIPPQVACGGVVNFSQYIVPGGIVTEQELAAHVEVEVGEQLANLDQFVELAEKVESFDGRITEAQEAANQASTGIQGLEEQIEDLGEQITPKLNQLNSKLGDVISEVDKQEERIDDISEQIGDITIAGIKNYDTYAEYNVDKKRGSRDISFVNQDNSVWVRGKQYSMNAGCCVGSSEANTPSPAWYLVAESNVAHIGDDINLLVYCGDYLLSKNAGLFALNIRFQSASNITIQLFQWIAKIGDTPLLRVAINGTNIKLYARVKGGQYRGANFTVLSSKADYNNNLKSPNTFVFADNNVYETTEPSGTDIADVPYLSKDGTATSANKLATSRNIGFASFDGTANVSLNAIQGAFNVRWATNTTQWQRVIRLKTNVTYSRNTIILAVQDSESINFSGILKFQARTGNTTSTVFTDVKWLALSQRYGDVTKSFRIYVTRPTDTDEYAYIDLYANSAYTYVQMLFNVLSHNVIAGVTYGGSGEWVEESAIPGILESESTYEVFDELSAIKARLAALEAKTTTES